MRECVGVGGGEGVGEGEGVGVHVRVRTHVRAYARICIVECLPKTLFHITQRDTVGGGGGGGGGGGEVGNGGSGGEGASLGIKSTTGLRQIQDADRNPSQSSPVNYNNTPRTTAISYANPHYSQSLQPPPTLAQHYVDQAHDELGSSAAVAVVQSRSALLSAQPL